jgi:hypothetical protein
MNIITCTKSLRKFLIALRLTLLLTKSQLANLTSIIASAMRGGFDDVRLVTVGNQKYWVHRVNGFIKRLPKTGVILLSWPENKLFEENATHVFYSTCNLLEEVILSTYTERRTVEIFFRDNKMQLELDRYQVRGKQAIQRFLQLLCLLMPIVQAYHLMIAVP